MPPTALIPDTQYFDPVVNASADERQRRAQDGEFSRALHLFDRTVHQRVIADNAAGFAMRFG